MVNEALVRDVWASLRAREAKMVAQLRALVEIESPSDNRGAAEQCGAAVAEQLAALGGIVQRHQGGRFADHVQADFEGAGKRRVLLLGHYDTVYPVGTLKTMPCRESGGRLYGPGVFDMKAGIVMAQHAIAELRRASGDLPCQVTALFVSDEEVGSESSRPITEALAKRCDAVLVLEPAGGTDGAAKTSRKGVGDYIVTVRGVASHAGLDFEKGHNAITELARQILEITKFTDLSRGLTINPGVIRGGTRTNVVASEAQVEVDLRVTRVEDAAEIEKRMAALKPFDPACSIEITGGLNRPPLERTEKVERLYKFAREISGALDLELQEMAVGGGSDGNFTAGLGIPTLDGLGAVGEGAHSVNENVIVSEIPRRTALVAGLIDRLAGV